MPQPDSLARLERAARNRERAEREYRSALVDAKADGHSYAELARVVGITRQAVRDALTRR